MHVALGLEVDLGQHLVGGVGQQGVVDLAAAGHHQVTGPGAGQLQRLLDGVGDQHALVAPAEVAGQHDRRPPGQGPADGLEGGAAHEEGVPPGELLELRLLTGEAPRDVGAVADHPVAGVGRHQHDPLVGAQRTGHTAMGALMPGWGS